jgi:hypothetical protein
MWADGVQFRVQFEPQSAALRARAPIPPACWDRHPESAPGCFWGPGGRRFKSCGPFGSMGHKIACIPGRSAVDSALLSRFALGSDGRDVRRDVRHCTKRCFMDRRSAHFDEEASLR